MGGSSFIVLQVRYVDDEVRADDCSAYLAYVVAATSAVQSAAEKQKSIKFHNSARMSFRADYILQTSCVFFYSAKCWGPIWWYAGVCSFSACRCTGGEFGVFGMLTQSPAFKNPSCQRITAGLFSRPGWFVSLYLLVVISLAAHSHHWLADGHCLRSCKARHQVYAFLISRDLNQHRTHHEMAGATFLQKQASFIWHTTMYDMIVQALQPCQLWCWSSHAIFESCLLETSPTDGGLLWKSSLDTTPNDRNPSGTFLLIRYFFKSASVLWLCDSEPRSVPGRKHRHVHNTRCFRSGTALEDFVRDSLKCTFLMLRFLEVFW